MSDKNLAEEFSRLLVEPKNTFEAYFLEFSPCTSIANTDSEFSCHMIRIDASGKDRTEAIANMVSQRIISYAIPRSEIAKAQELDRDENATSHFTALYKKAQSLFTDLKQTGECGEMLLYLFANTYLKAPQVLCKMPFKTSSKLHYQGIDGLHAKYDEEKDCFLLFWGEAKVYSNISDAFTKCFNSISSILLSNWGSTDPAERDLQFFRDNIDFDDPEMESLVLNFLDVDNPKSLKLKNCGVCFIGIDEDAYSKITENEVKQELISHVASWQKSLETRIINKGLEKIFIHIFLVPFPSVERYRQAFLKELSLS